MSSLSGPFVRVDDSQTKGKDEFWEGKLLVRPGFEIRLVVRAWVKNGAEPTAATRQPG